MPATKSAVHLLYKLEPFGGYTPHTNITYSITYIHGFAASVAVITGVIIEQSKKRFGVGAWTPEAPHLWAVVSLDQPSWHGLGKKHLRRRLAFGLIHRTFIAVCMYDIYVCMHACITNKHIQIHVHVRVDAVLQQ